ncbi:MAG: Lpg1974 family pore-forming outer membrane protein [Planctomyces sp.]
MRTVSTLCRVLIITGTIVGYSVPSAAETGRLFSPVSSDWLHSISGRSIARVSNDASSDITLQDSDDLSVRPASPEDSILSQTPPPAPFDAEDDFSDDELNNLEGRIASLESQLSQLRRQQRPGAPRSESIFAADARRSYLYGAIDVLLIRPHLSSARSNFNPLIGQWIDSEPETSLRYILGYQTSSGVGFRGQYWGFDTDTPVAANQLGLHMDVADAEITLAQPLRNWNLGVSGGVRYARMDFNTPPGLPGGIRKAVFEGTGPTIALDARRNLGTTGLSLFGTTRGAILFGDINNSGLFNTTTAGIIHDETTHVFENQMGVAYTRLLAKNRQLELRGAWETQYWLNDTFADDSMGLGSNLTFYGPSIRAEIRF